MRKLVLATVLAALATACSSTGRYGAPVPGGETVQAVTLLHHPELYDGKTVLVEARVDEVCPQKGCWMLVRDGDKSMRVTFEDYGFFVPKDSAGSTARMQGKFAVVDVSAEDTKHYLEDAGRHDEAAKITAPVRTLTFVASGVELRKQ